MGETFISAPLRESSEECAIQLYHYTPQDEIDKGNFVYLLIRDKRNHSKMIIKFEKGNLRCKKFIWELKIPAKERFKLCDDNLDEDLRGIMRAIIQKAIEETCLNRGIRPTSFFQSSFQLLEEENEENLVGPI
ncbi:hypothetical protein Glove_139g301 [Diversispora epigaea]|uniref:Uncharacterized protein n=1 Tax=Diversispora epigaea TaxID=1348612 RepID=A0A397J0F5_9GLOM|nr:hypothetical protein Glove_139g301 [Diversispora epigaea]